MYSQHPSSRRRKKRPIHGVKTVQSTGTLELQVAENYNSSDSSEDEYLPRSKSRLRIEQKIHTLVLMDVSAEGVRLTSGVGSTIAHYSVEKLAFSGICPDDKRFFGIVTLHAAADDVSEDSDDDDDDTESEDDPFVRRIISQFNKDRVLDFGEENPRRFSEGFALAKK
nr:hypothetical protein BaRGS_030877 [Batillaria attramentaria]